MAERGVTLKELKAMTKPQLTDIALQLKLNIKGLKKQEIIDEIIGGATTTEATELTQIVTREKDTSSQNGSEKGSPIRTPVHAGTDKGMGTLQFQLEMRKLEMEQERCMRDLQLRHELELARIAARSAETIRENTSFRIDTAMKLEPKLASEYETETYFITFEKIAELNAWPKQHWAIILQSQLRGKGLKVFNELSNEDCTNYDNFKTALLAAYELCAEVYRERFRCATKSVNETYADFAFNLQNMFKRWTQSLKADTDIELLRQAILMEQFMEITPQEIKLWLIDQKVTTLTELASAADKYVALRKSINPAEQARTTYMAAP
jgi:hypothetical protein